MRQAMYRCEPCLGMGYKGRDRRGKWKIETCRACGGSGQKHYARNTRNKVPA